MRLAHAMFFLLAAPLTADAGDSAFQGRWTIDSSMTAPWEDPSRPMITDDAQRLIGKTVTITADSLRGADMMDCGKTEIMVGDMPFAGLFEGGLATDPQHPERDYDEPRARTLAHQLGFKSEPVATLSHGCSEIQLHMRDPDTIMFGLDNRIFVMTRR